MDQETRELVESVNQLKQDVDHFREVDTKLEHMGLLMMQIRDGIVSSHASLAKHDLTLDEIRVKADFRKRESENSVREIKSQMDDMEHDMETSMTSVVIKVVDRIDAFERNHRNSITEISTMVRGEIDDLKRRVGAIERWNAFHLTMLVIVSVVVLLIP